MEKENKILASTGSDNYPTVYSLNTFKGKRLFDVRKYYKKKDGDEVLPTTKGISLNASSFQALIDVIKDRDAEIIDWLNDKLNETDELSKKLIAQADMVREEQHKAKLYKHSSEKLSNGNFYSIKYDGDNRELIFNQEHALYEKIKQMSEENLIIISNLIMSFHHATELFDDQQINSTDFIESVINNWSITLKNYMAKYD